MGDSIRSCSPSPAASKSAGSHVTYANRFTSVVSLLRADTILIPALPIPSATTSEEEMEPDIDF